MVYVVISIFAKQVTSVIGWLTDDTRSGKWQF